MVWPLVEFSTAGQNFDRWSKRWPRWSNVKPSADGQIAVAPGDDHGALAFDRLRHRLTDAFDHLRHRLIRLTTCATVWPMNIDHLRHRLTMPTVWPIAPSFDHRLWFDHLRHPVALSAPARSLARSHRSVCASERSHALALGLCFRSPLSLSLAAALAHRPSFRPPSPSLALLRQIPDSPLLDISGALSLAVPAVCGGECVRPPRTRPPSARCGRAPCGPCARVKRGAAAEAQKQQR